jgi:hypothetical protein
VEQERGRAAVALACPLVGETKSVDGSPLAHNAKYQPRDAGDGAGSGSGDRLPGSPYCPGLSAAGARSRMIPKWS